ncbi:MAG: Trk system potassium transporter TrkA [Spirochaetaceae bacterium]|nr:MAG: Trk system potassium transporter TrkA [Spirochaetaceae bacterium]
MKAVILGAGAVGFQIARQLVDNGQDVVVIEKDRNQASYVSNRLDCMVINDAGNNLEVLSQAGCETADFFIAVTDSDEVNMVSCALVHSEFAAPRTVARVRNLEYSTARIAERGLLGIDYVVNPEIEAAHAIIQSLERGALSDVMLFQHAELQIRPITVTAGSFLDGKSLRETARTIDLSFLVAAVLTEKGYIIPSGDTVIRAGDTIYVVASEPDFEKIFHRLGKDKRELNRIIIVGGGRIGAEIAEHLLHAGKRPPPSRRRGIVSQLKAVRLPRVKIVERDYQKCRVLSERFPEALVINADISDEEVFDEEQFAESDLIVAATDNQELNIVTALYARSLGIKRTIVLVKKVGYSAIATSLGIDVAVSFKHTMVNNILTFMRRGPVRSVHSVADGRIEIIELAVDPQCRAAHKPVREIKLPPGSLILAVAHGRQNVIPTGERIIHPGDHIVVITGKEHVEELQEVFTAP